MTELKEELKNKKVLDSEGLKASGNAWLEQSSFRMALMGIFTALSIVLGYMLIAIPNIEVYTLILFLSGFIMGKRDGAIIGLMSSFIFCFFNPMGSSPLPLLTVQMSYYCLVGFIGGITSAFMKKKDFFKPEEDLYVFPVIFILGLIGAIMTFTYDITSSLVDSIWLFGTLDAFVPYYLSGIIFTTVHLIGNILGFIFILPALIQLIYTMIDIQ